MASSVSEKDNRRIISYIIISLGWSYIFWIIAAIISTKNPDWIGIQILHFLGGIGPLVAAIYTVTNMKDWKGYLRRCIDFSSYSPFDWLILLSPLLIALVVSLITEGSISLSQEFLNSGLVYAIFLFFFGPLPEEIGWRGVLFDLLSKQSITKAQIITAAVWFSWHLPLFFIVGSYQHGVGFATSGFLLWSVGLIVQSIIMGYLYILTNRSIASAIIFHYFVNLAGEALDLPNSAEIMMIGLYVLIVVFLAIIYNKKIWNRSRSS
jgi:membrane protease YdiL (CAAX protease family)